MKIKKVCAFIFVPALFFLTLSLTEAQAQTKITEAGFETANAFFQAGEWEKAAGAFGKIVISEPENAAVWFQFAVSLDHLQNYEEAARAYKQANRLGYFPIRTRYRLARVHALLNQNDVAFEWLEKAVDAGFGEIERLRTDEDLKDLRKNSKFRILLEKADKNARPCEYDARFRQFDFWIGEWNVQSSQGHPAGTNIIQKIENGCILLENWTGTAGPTGKSVNFFDAHLGKWRQTWISSAGSISEFAGAFQGDAMRFEGETHTRAGEKILRRLTFYKLAPDRVRQLSEASTDAGKTWSVSYDFIYLKKN